MILGKDEEWELQGERGNNDVIYKHKIYPDLFKIVKDGKTSYKDFFRVYGINDQCLKEANYTIFDNLVDELFPISMPYDPNTKYCVIFNDTKRIPHSHGVYIKLIEVRYKTGDVKIIPINKYYKYVNHCQEYCEITRQEYNIN